MKNQLKVEETWFSWLLLIIPFVAWVNPKFGAQSHFSSAFEISQVAIFLIFFMRGISLNISEIFQAAGRYQLNLTIQLISFIAIPLLTYLICQTIFNFFHFPNAFIVGTLILSCLPITTASCVVLTAMVKGNEASAIFNSFISNLIGIFSAPVALTFLLSKNPDFFRIHPWPVAKELLFFLVIPMVLGQLTSFFFKRLATHHLLFHRLTEIIILYIIYSGFCNSFIEIFKLHSFYIPILSLIAGMFFLHLFFLGISFCAGKILKFSISDIKTLLCTAPQKTIILGIPLVLAILSSIDSTSNLKSNFGLYTLPLLIYYDIKWLVATLLIPKLVRWN